MSGHIRSLMLGACAAGALALAGCSSGDKAGEAGDKDEAAATADTGLDPGQWDTEITLQKVELDKADPDLNEFFKGAAGQKNNATMCLKAEDAAKPNAEFFQGKNSNCQYDTFTMSGGKIDSELTCKDGPLSLKVTMTGTYPRTAMRSKQRPRAS